MRENLLQLVVATIQTDVVKHLRADWCFRSDYAELLTFSGPCECSLAVLQSTALGVGTEERARFATQQHANMALLVLNM